MNFIDLGLPSGTLWAESNEEGFYTFDEAVEKYSNNMPTNEQLGELKDYCKWEWMGDGYKITGHNGNAITLPAAGIRSCFSGVYYVGLCGFYWSSTPDDSYDAWSLFFDSSDVIADYSYLRYGLSVRLVKNKNNNMNKILNLGKVKLTMRDNGFPKGFILKRELTLREARYLMSQLLGIDISDRDCFEFQYEYKEYNDGLCQDVNAWLRGDADDSVIAEYAYDCSDEQLGMHNMLIITQYLIKKGII